MTDHTPDLSNPVLRYAFFQLPAHLPKPWQQDGDAAAADRTIAAMEQIRRLDPQDRAEVDIALSIVGGIAWANDCLREAAANDGDIELVRQCRAQAAASMRHAFSQLRNFRPQIVADWQWAHVLE